MKYYFYARVSSDTQNEQRQLDASKEFEQKNSIKFDEIIVEKMSGKNFEDRPQYEQMRKKLEKGDCVVFLSLDRMGRNYLEIQEEWRFITKVIEADIVIMDKDLLDTRKKGNDLTTRFVADLFLQVIAYVAEQERNNIKARQAQGIASAKAQGKRFGRPNTYSEEFIEQVHQDYEKGNVTIKELSNKYGVSTDRINVWKRDNHWTPKNKKRK